MLDTVICCWFCWGCILAYRSRGSILSRQQLRFVFVIINDNNNNKNVWRFRVLYNFFLDILLIAWIFHSNSQSHEILWLRKSFFNVKHPQFFNINVSHLFVIFLCFGYLNIIFIVYLFSCQSVLWYWCE